MNIKNILIGAIVLLLAGLGVGYYLPHSAKLGAISNNYQAQIIPQWFVNGACMGNAQQWCISSTGAITSTGNSTKTGNEVIIGSLTTQTLALNFGLGSTTTPTSTLSSTAGASIGSPIVSSGHLVIQTGQTTASASTTAIDLNSDVQVQLEQTTPIPGTTCNTNLVASSTDAVSIVASTTNTSLNGFVIKVANAPVTNPFCFSFSATN